MAPIVYQCIVCQICVTSINDLHSHHTENHTIEELSNAIINLRGFRCVPLSIDHFITDYTSPDIYSSICNSTAYKSNFRDLVQLTNKQDTGTIQELSTSGPPKIDIADTEEFKTWERELSKNIAISEEDFLQCVTGLCNDLTNKKSQTRKNKGRPKIHTEQANSNKENICLSNEIGSGIIVGKSIEESCSVQPINIATGGTIEMLCNAISEDFNNATALQNNNTVHLNTETLLGQTCSTSTCVDRADDQAISRPDTTDDIL